MIFFIAETRNQKETTHLSILDRIFAFVTVIVWESVVISLRTSNEINGLYKSSKKVVKTGKEQLIYDEIFEIKINSSKNQVNFKKNVRNIKINYHFPCSNSI